MNGSGRTKARSRVALMLAVALCCGLAWPSAGAPAQAGASASGRPATGDWLSAGDWPLTGGRQPAGTIIAPDVPPNPDPSELGPQIMAVAVEPRAAEADGEVAGASERRGRLVVIGDVDFLQDRFVQSNPQNLAFAANAVDWLAQDEALIAIRAKNRTPPPLVFETDFTRAALKWGNLVGVPLLFVAWGTSRVLRRRRLASRRWQEELAA